MSAGAMYMWERAQTNDRATGAAVMRLTGYPVINQKFYPHCNCFTADSQSLVFLAPQYAHRDAPWDAYRVDVDGAHLCRLTAGKPLQGAVVSPDGDWLYYLNDGELRRVGLSSFKDESICKLEGVSTGIAMGSVSHDGTRYVASGVLPGGRHALLRYRTDGSAADMIHEADVIYHTQYEPQASEVILFRSSDARGGNLSLLDDDGRRLRELGFPRGYGHFMWQGIDRRVMAVGNAAEWGIALMGEQDEARILLDDSRHYWHGACSADGQWVVADSNWPDEGIYLLHTGTRKSRLLCLSNSSNGHPQWTHPHPSFSPDGTKVLFQSDQTGIPHLYAVTIPESMRQELASSD